MLDPIKNSKGQSLIEYLIIVAIVAVGSIGIVKTLGATIKVRFANITNALQNDDHTIQTESVTPDQYEKRGLDDFFKGAGRN